MITSIIDDFKNTFRSGNMISRIILVNVCVYILINLINVFDFNSGFSTILIRKLSLVSDPLELLKQFWAIGTHMFLHMGFWHILWNMLLLYWFGRIIGDFLGDRRVLPLYILGGLAGGLAFILWDQLSPTGMDGASYAYGASAAVWAIIMATTLLSPDYIFHLMFLGPVKIKYITLVMLFFDLIGTAGNVNTGGHFGHLGGAFLGVMFVHFLRKGTDITEPLQRLLALIPGFSYQGNRRKTPRENFKVYRNERVRDNEPKQKEPFKEQNELDRILDKIKAEGYDNLSSEEKEFLYQASKKK
jgi:membrane associated rhomboid family serine protease